MTENTPSDALAEAMTLIERLEAASGRITELERQLKVAREALGYADSWLGRWAQHVGNCKGEFLCTCGLTRIRFDVSQALANMEQADD